MTEECPNCRVNLRGEPIPQKYLDAGYYGDTTHYSRTIGMEVMGVYDGVLYWMCPDCAHKWHRWPAGHYLRERAAKFVGDK